MRDTPRGFVTPAEAAAILTADLLDLARELAPLLLLLDAEDAGTAGWRRRWAREVDAACDRADARARGRLEAAAFGDDGGRA